MDRLMELPPEPLKPLDSDCCGQGCIPCVYDIYDEEMKIWARECKRIQNGEKHNVDGDINTVNVPQLSPTEYCKFKIERITKETKDTNRYRFQLPYGCTLGLDVGQHILIRGHVNGETVTRQYTPISDVSTESCFELMIKLYDEGKLSEYVRTWDVGWEIEMRGPCGDWRYTPNKYRRVVMLCVGTGIAPMCQVIQHILNNDSDDTYIELLYGCRKYDEILLKTELDDWSRFWNFSVTYYLSQDSGETNYKYGDKVIHSRIGVDALTMTFTNILDVFILVCGTRPFEKDMIACLDTLDISTNIYHKF